MAPLAFGHVGVSGAGAAAMTLNILDRSPPPLFRPGPSALTKLAFCTALAVFLMVADLRLGIVQPLRAALAALLHPVERVLLVPVELAGRAADYLAGLAAALAARDDAQRKLAAYAVRAERADALAGENERLRALLALNPQRSAAWIAAQVLYAAADLYSRKVVIDRGATQGIEAGAPVITEAGVVGQVTRVYPLHAEVTLLTDKDAAIPVMNARTRQRSAAYGGLAGGTAMELRFVAGHADVQVGDALVTSGLDGVYPPGLPVATVVKVERRGEGGFARIELTPAPPLDNVRLVLVLNAADAQRPAPAESEPLPSRMHESRRAGK